MTAEEAFREPDWSAPLDAEARIAAAPEDGTVRGMFLQEVIDIAATRGIEVDAPKYVAFAKYPLRDYLRLLREGASKTFPDRPPRLALRMLGHHVYPNFASTMVGTAIFALAGKDFLQVSKLAARAYGVSVTPGTVRTTEVGPCHIRASLRSIWPYPDCFQVGVWEGAMQVCGVAGPVAIRSCGAWDIDYDIQWKPKGE